MIQRKPNKLIENQLYKGKAIILIGARQVGKTTLLNHIAQESDLPTLMMNCDEPESRAVLSDTNVAKLNLLIGDHKLLIIDEAQKVDGIGTTLKLIVDNFIRRKWWWNS